VRALLLGQGAAQEQPERRREMTGAKEKKNSFNQAHKPPSRDKKTGEEVVDQPSVGPSGRSNLFLPISRISYGYLTPLVSFFKCYTFVCFIISNDGGSSPDFPRRLSLFTQRQKILIGAEKRRSAI
jgi:hypothetical protein